MAKLNAAARKSLPKTDFAVSSKANTPQGKAKGGSYPIPDKSHAKNALARSAGKPVAGQVKAAVKRKFPNMKVGGNIQKTIGNIKTKLKSHGKSKSSVGF